MSRGKSFEIDVKRFYMPGHELADTCKKCGQVVTHDLGERYISYPVANEPADHCFYCGECDHEWKRKILVTVAVHLLPNVSRVQEAT